MARGFRDPILSDRFYRGPVGRGFIEGNPDLKPETSLQFDLTARYTAGPVRLAAAGYHYRINDLVERYAATPTLFLLPQSRPGGAAGRRGRGADNAAARLRPGGDRGNVARPRRHRSTRRSTTSRRRLCPQHSATRAGTRVGSYIRIKAVGSHDAAGPSEVATRSYTLADAGVSWRVTPHLEVRGAHPQPPERGLPVERRPSLGLGARAQGSVTVVVGF